MEFNFLSPLIFFVGILIGFISVTVGGAGLVNIPFLMIIGLNPASAIATSRLSVISSLLSGSIRYYKQGLIKCHTSLIYLTVLTLIGSILGTILVLKIDQQLLKIIIIILQILMLIILSKNNLEKSAKTANSSTLSKIIGSFVFLLLGFYLGFFGAGFGTFVIFSLIYFFNFSFAQSAAVMTVINFIALTLSVVIFGYHGMINYQVGIPLLAGSTIGGWLGAHYAILKGNFLLKKLIFAVALILIIKLIFDLI